MKLLSKIILIALLHNFSLQVQAQKIWPGDVNNNGIANGVDFLYLITAWEETGPARPGAETDWEEQDVAPDWADDFNNGINFSYADCDGDGVVNHKDINALRQNFHETHGTVTPDVYNTGTGGSNPRVALTIPNSNILYGETIEVSVDLGDSNMNIQDFYGISFTMEYTPDLVAGGDDWEFDFPPGGSWVNPLGTDDNVRSITFNDENTGKAEIAFGRTDLVPVSGAGKVGSFSIIIEDYVVGRAETDTFNLEIKEVLLIDKNFNSAPIAGDTLDVTVNRVSSVASKNTDEFPVSIYPNPSAGEFTIEIPEEIQIDEILLYNTLGCKIPCLTYPKRGKIHVSAHPKILQGMYFLLLRSDRATVIQKLKFE